MIEASDLFNILLISSLLPIMLILIYHFLWFSRIGYLQCEVQDQYFGAQLRAWFLILIGIFQNKSLLEFGSVQCVVIERRRKALRLAGIIYGGLWGLFFLVLYFADVLDFKVSAQDLLLILLVMPLIAFDFRYYLLPNTLTQPLLWSGITCALLGVLPITIEESIWGVLLGYLLMYTLYFLSHWYYKYEAIGFGDVKFVAGLGAWIGIDAILPFLLVSSLLGIAAYLFIYYVPRILVGAIKVQRGENDSLAIYCRRISLATSLKTHIAFGPYLGISGIIFYFAARISEIQI